MFPTGYYSIYPYALENSLPHFNQFEKAEVLTAGGGRGEGRGEEGGGRGALKLVRLLWKKKLATVREKIRNIT